MPYKDYTAGTEVDGGGHISVTASRITFTNMDRNGDAYLYFDEGVNHFDSHFINLMTGRISSADASGQATVWMVSNVLDDLAAQWGSNDVIRVGLTRHSGGAYNLLLQARAGGGSSATDTYVYSLDTTYYMKVVRNENIGASGTMYLYIYSNTARTTLVDTLTIALDFKTDFRYMYGLNNWNSSSGEQITGWVENLSAQEAVMKLVNGGLVNNGLVGGASCG